jgi:3-isopropylmalate/(R)-2-methylmalate dehydratase small subunit
MQAFIKHEGVGVAMDRADVDTDQIIPKQFLKRIERDGFEEFLFFDWRYDDAGNDNPEFELNQPDAAAGSILVAGRNFGCGSSREHAVWALENYGFRVVIAESFADIFFNNCFKNGVLPIALSAKQVEGLFQKIQEATSGPYRLAVDLETQTIQDEDGLEISFEIEPFRRNCLLEGLDDIALTMKQDAAIADYEEQNKDRLARA